MGGMASKLGNITFDCGDPTALATFWADVFGYPHPEWPEDLRKELLDGGLNEEDLANKSAIEDPTGVGPRLFFQRVPEGKTAKNRMHVDIRATPGRRPTLDELVAEKDRVVALGATVLVDYDSNWGPVPERHFVMQDPEGNEFCID
jgi:catechol 2,3-dioxygenase-like lactoylglutathione lyase family enzyme